MPHGEKATYFLYREGYDLRMLNLGGLVFDFSNPTHLEPYRHPPLRYA